MNKTLLIVASVAMAVVVGCTSAPPPEPTVPAVPKAAETALAAAPKAAETVAAAAPKAAETVAAAAPQVVETAVAAAPKVAETAAAAAPTVMAIPGLPAVAKTAAAAAGQGVTGELGAGAFIAALRIAGIPIANSETYTADTDPDKLLGRPNQYVGKAAWQDTRINVSPAPGKAPEPGVATGGIVEIFANEQDRQTRQAALTDSAKQPAAGQYVYSKGRVLVRVSKDLTPEQAADYERALSNFVG